MISGLTKVEKVYHIENIGNLSEKIKTIKKISDHPILIFKKNIPFKRKPGIISLNTYNYNIIEKNMQQIREITTNPNEEFTPELIDPKIIKTKKISESLQIDNEDYNKNFEEIKKHNLERFKELKKRNIDELSMLFETN